MYNIEPLTNNLEINWNGKLQPVDNTVMDDIFQGFWEVIEDIHYDKLAEKYDKSDLWYNDDPNWYRKKKI